MAKLIAKFAYAKLKNVEIKKGVQIKDWEWRKSFIGKSGTLSLFESEHKRPGERFLHINCFEGGWLTTGCGKLDIGNTELTITTGNSIYVFEIGGKEYQLWVDEKTVPEP